MHKRTEYERALVRRVANKSDYLRYIEYEMGLEQLRRKRVQRLSECSIVLFIILYILFYVFVLFCIAELGEGPTTVSDYGLIRRQFHIFERALKKFKDDIGLWIEYISVAKKEGAKTLAGRLIGRAIQMHPTTASLYILGASHELEQQAPSAARTLLQRGLRLNKTNIELWREYVKMEMEFVSLMQKRWTVLGIEASGSATGDSKSDEDGGSGSAREDILAGAIVKQAISSAVSGMWQQLVFRGDELTDGIYFVSGLQRCPRCQ
jgi:U3 small nucleolar RNA-associated protein 6